MDRLNSSELVRLLLEHRDGIFGFILALTRDREAAEEIFQEVGLAVVEEAGDGTRVARFVPWVHEIARRRTSEYYRKSSKRRAFERSESLDDAVSLAFQENASDPASLRQRQDHLTDCLDQLSETQRDLIEQRYRDRVPLRRIADSVDSTEGSIKVTLWRARRQLAKCIEGKMGPVEGAR